VEPGGTQHHEWLALESPPAEASSPIKAARDRKEEITMSRNPTRGHPLDGIRVLDLTHAAAGPYATMWLADLGAEVIKIERPGTGDATRNLGSPHFGPDASEYFVAINRSKKSVSLDLTEPSAVEIVKRLASECDIVVQNFRPGVVERLGIGFEDLRGARTGLIFASISGFGQTGSWKDLPANDIIVQSASGLMSLTGERGGHPIRIGASISDFGSGLFALSGILAALFSRDRFPEGQHIEVSMLDSSIALAANYIPSVATLGETIARPGRTHPQIVPYQAFDCQDGESVMVGAFTETFWRSLAVLLGRADWIDDPRFASNATRLRHRDQLIPPMEEIFRERPRGEWIELLQGADIPCTPIRDLGDATTSEQAVHNGSVAMLDQNGVSVGVTASPIRSGQWAPVEMTAAPGLGEHTGEVLEHLGFASDKARRPDARIAQ
jgi:crotonobetainyl-CoA:carnitine CoA-transferase CaiB-like acyl-CoA transferase